MKITVVTNEKTDNSLKAFVEKKTKKTGKERFPAKTLQTQGKNNFNPMIRRFGGGTRG